MAGIRARIAAEIAKTPVGVALAAAAAANGSTVQGTDGVEPSAAALHRQLADGAAFAGMFGTYHLVASALARLRSDPAVYRPLFDADPIAFLHEEARVDPPVTSITALVGRDGASVQLGPSGAAAGVAHFAPGTPFQVSIAACRSSAHTHPQFQRARTFSCRHCNNSCGAGIDRDGEFGSKRVRRSRRGVIARSRIRPISSAAV